MATSTAVAAALAAVPVVVSAAAAFVVSAAATALTTACQHLDQLVDLLLGGLAVLYHLAREVPIAIGTRC